MERRKTFVLWILRDRVPNLEGRLEEVETGVELRFASAQQLVEHLEARLAKGDLHDSRTTGTYPGE